MEILHRWTREWTSSSCHHANETSGILLQFFFSFKRINSFTVGGGSLELDISLEVDKSSLISFRATNGECMLWTQSILNWHVVHCNEYKLQVYIYEYIIKHENNSIEGCPYIQIKMHIEDMQHILEEFKDNHTLLGHTTGTSPQIKGIQLEPLPAQPWRHSPNHHYKKEEKIKRGPQGIE